MAFGKAVVSEPADLLEHPLGELPGDPLGHHACHQPVAVPVDPPGAMPRRHVAAKLIGLARRVVGRHHRELHHLLLKERHPERLAQHRFETRMRIVGRLLAVATPQVGMDHPAGDRAGTHDADLDDQIVVVAGLEPGQHRHLRAALDLKDADRVPTADQSVGPRIVGRDPMERQAPIVMPFEQTKAQVELGQRAEPEQVHLEEPEVLQVVLVPLDHGAPGHRRVLDRHEIMDRLVAEEEAARMDREMPREVLDLCAQPGEVVVQRGGRVEPGVRELRRPERGVVREQPGEAVEGGLGETERLADLAHRGPGTIAHHIRHHGGVIASVPAIDVLDHLLASRVHDVEVDVGRLVPLTRQEPLEQQIDPHRIDRRDPEAVADHRVRGRAAALAEDPLAPAVLDDLPHGQEVAAVVELVDQRELLVDLLPDGRWHATGAGEVLARPAQGDLAKPCGRGLAVGESLGRIAVADLGQGEGAAPRHLVRALDERRLVGEQPCHRLRRLEIVLGIGLDQPAGGGEGDAVADAGEDILKIAACRCVVEHLGGGDQGEAGALGVPAHACLPAHLLGAAMSAHHRVQAVAERVVHRRDDPVWHFIPDQQAPIAAPERNEAVGPRADLRPGHA